jgi:hypothetical protein
VFEPALAGPVEQITGRPVWAFASGGINTSQDVPIEVF